jgi:hypothetical protein
MFSLDMVGMYEAHKGLDLTGVRLLNNWEELTGELANKYQIQIRKANSSIGQRTDTAPFGELGIPAIHAYTGTESPYHKPEDEAHLLDYEGMALVTNYLSAATHKLASGQDLSNMKGPGEEVTAAAGSKVFKAGFRIGTGSSRHNYKTEFFEGKSVFAAEAGLFASIRVTNFLRLQPEVLYETKGSKHMSGNYRTHSVTTPVNLLLGPNSGAMVQTYFLFGGYYSYHFSGQLDGEPIDFQNEYDNQEFGLSYGFGFQVMNVQIGILIRNGLSSIRQDPAEGSIQQEGVAFSLGFTF